MFYLFTGLSAELYYVRDGFVNEYALHFTVPVPANIRDISFTWQSLAGRPVNIIAFSLFNNKSISEFPILPPPPCRVACIHYTPFVRYSFRWQLSPIAHNHCLYC